jgi:hypothetical protein
MNDLNYYTAVVSPFEVSIDSPSTFLPNCWLIVDILLSSHECVFAVRRQMSIYLLYYGDDKLPFNKIMMMFHFVLD